MLIIIIAKLTFIKLSNVSGFMYLTCTNELRHHRSPVRLVVAPLIP